LFKFNLFSFRILLFFRDWEYRGLRRALLLICLLYWTWVFTGKHQREVQPLGPGAEKGKVEGEEDGEEDRKQG
jgi:hypothetical protein